MIDYIEIEGYKSIKKAKVDLKPINILIGANGAGKSNFISFFELINKLYNRNLQEYVSLRGGVAKMLHKGIEATEALSFHLEFDREQNGYAVTIQAGDESFVFTREQLIYQGNNWDISGYGKEAKVKSSDLIWANQVRKYLDSLKRYHFHDTGRNSPFNKESSAENDIHFLYEQGENLAAFLRNIREEHQLVYNRIVNTIQSIAPFFSDFYLMPNEGGYIRLQWQDKYSSTTYGVTDLSDGTIRFIALATLFLQPTLPDTIIIDEPELGLHPFAIAKLAGMIESAANRGCQVIVATQSAELVNHFKADDIITVDQREGETYFNRLREEDFSQWLEEYSIGDLWQREIIKGGQTQ
ncbi:AAA family ATPase [soil metagenome]